MATYKHLNTGIAAELIVKDDLRAKMKVSETGEIKDMSLATFKRWWKPVEEEVVEVEDIDELLEEFAEIEIDDNLLEGTASDYEAEPIQERPVESQIDQNEPEPDEAEESLPEDPEVPEGDQNVSEDAPLTLSAIVAKLEGLFDLLNELYFENALSKQVITVQSTPRAYGHCSTKKIWAAGENDDKARYEINIGAEYLNRASENTAAVMCHEMVHLYCRENDIEETCQNGRYHNKLFKQEAEARDLKIGYERAIGYSPTEPTKAFIAKLCENGYALEVPFARNTIEKGKSKTTRQKAHKYLCHICGQEVRSTADLNLICGNCEITMERAS